MVGNGIEAFGLRDDAAVLDPPSGGPLVASVDSVVEGLHFELALCSPADVGWKALMGALSDLAAMGAFPAHSLVTVAGPAGTDLIGLYTGLGAAAAALACPIVGGDTGDPFANPAIAALPEDWVAALPGTWCGWPV